MRNFIRFCRLLIFNLILQSGSHSILRSWLDHFHKFYIRSLYQFSTIRIHRVPYFTPVQNRISISFLPAFVGSLVHSPVLNNVLYRIKSPSCRVVDRRVSGILARCRLPRLVLLDSDHKQKSLCSSSITSSPRSWATELNSISAADANFIRSIDAGPGPVCFSRACPVAIEERIP